MRDMRVRVKISAISLVLSGMLFQKAVLDWDTKNPRSFADKPMVEMAGNVVSFYSKHDSIPSRFRLSSVPTLISSGPPVLDDRSESMSMSPLASSMMAVVREVQWLCKSIRIFTRKKEVHLDSSADSGNAVTEDLKREHATLSTQCQELERTLRRCKGSSGQPGDRLQSKLTEREQTIKQQKTRLHKLEGDMQGLSDELVMVKREKTELLEKTNRMQKESLPLLDKMRTMLVKSQDIMERLETDSGLVSDYFRKQVKAIEATKKDTQALQEETKAREQQLKEEHASWAEKDRETRQKERKYLRVIAAAQCIKDSEAEREQDMQKIYNKIAEHDQDIERLRTEGLQMDEEVKKLYKEQERAKRRIEGLKEHRDACMLEYERLTGRPGSELLGKV